MWPQKDLKWNTSQTKMLSFPLMNARLAWAFILCCQTVSRQGVWKNQVKTSTKAPLIATWKFTDPISYGHWILKMMLGQLQQIHTSPLTKSLTGTCTGVCDWGQDEHGGTVEVRRKWDNPLCSTLITVICLDFLSLKNDFHVNYPVIYLTLLLGVLGD